MDDKKKVFPQTVNVDLPDAPEVDGIIAGIKAEAKLAASSEQSGSPLARVSSLIGLAGRILSIIHSNTKNGQEARFVIDLAKIIGNHQRIKMMDENKYTCPQCGFTGDMPAYYCEGCGRPLKSPVVDGTGVEN